MPLLQERRELATMRLRWWRQTQKSRGIPARVYLGKQAEVEVGPDGLLHIGPGVVFGSRASLTVHGTLEIGSGAYFNHDAHITCLQSVKIGAGARFGERVSIHDENHLFEPVETVDRAALTALPVIIEEDVWVGAGAIILPGARVGARTVVGAGSVVTGVIPEDVLAAGVPARVLRPLRS